MCSGLLEDRTAINGLLSYFLQCTSLNRFQEMHSARSVPSIVTQLCSILACKPGRERILLRGVDRKGRRGTWTQTLDEMPLLQL